MEGFIDSILDRLLATSVRTAVLVAIVWLLCRLLPRLSPATQCWLWWLVALQVLLGLFLAPLPLKWLPPESAMGSLGTSIAAPNQFSSLAGGAEPSMTAGTGWSWKVSIFLLWVSGLLVMAWSLLRDWQCTRGLLQGSTDCTDEARPRIVAAAAGASRVRAAPQLRMSDLIESPMVIGHFRPRLLLPTHARLSDEELLMAVAHELEHLRRADLWWGIIPVLARHCFFFHPLMHLAAREYDIAREAACDAAVVGAGESSRREYGELLLRLGTAQGAGAGLAAASPTFRALSRRLKLLQQRSFLPWAGSIAVLMLALAFVVPWRLAEPDTASVPGSNDASVTQPLAVSEPSSVGVLEIEADVAQREAEPARSSAAVGRDVAVASAQPVAPAPIQRVAVLHRPNSDDFYPAASRSLGEEGRTRLRICSDDLGRISDVSVTASSGFPRLDEAAVQMGWQYRLTPSVVDGVPAKRECFIQPVTFTQQPRMSVSYENAPIAMVLQQISGVSGRTIVADDSVSGTVTLRVDNMPWDQVLSRLLGAKRLVQQSRGNEIVISAAGGG